jgi:hypothetical protein
MAKETSVMHGNALSARADGAQQRIGYRKRLMITIRAIELKAKFDLFFSRAMISSRHIGISDSEKVGPVFQRLRRELRLLMGRS